MNFSLAIRRSVVPIWVAAGLAACGSDSGSSGSSRNGATTGDPCPSANKTDACQCDDGRTGAKTCDGATLTWGACECADPAPAGAGGGTTTTAQCGNGIIEGTEMCDGTNLNGETCASATMGTMSTGTLRCSSCMFDTTGCTGAGAGGAAGGGGTTGGGGMTGGGGTTP